MSNNKILLSIVACLIITLACRAIQVKPSRNAPALSPSRIPTTLLEFKTPELTPTQIPVFPSSEIMLSQVPTKEIFPEELEVTPTLDPETNAENQETDNPTLAHSSYVDETGTSMRLIPAGEFTMGNNDAHYDNEKPAHTVYLDSFYIDQYEVTNEYYRACVDNGVCLPPKNTIFYYEIEYKYHPVVFVDWGLANAYCEWRDARLPTEAEWEKAARGADERTYSWGEGIDCTKANYYGNDRSCIGYTREVGSYESGISPYGIYDMTGNVWEWVGDLYSGTYYKSSPLSNPLGPDSGQHRVLRGGSFSDADVNVRTSVRFADYPTDFSEIYGFRCAKSP